MIYNLLRQRLNKEFNVEMTTVCVDYEENKVVLTLEGGHGYEEEIQHLVARHTMAQFKSVVAFEGGREEAHKMVVEPNMIHLESFGAD